MIKVYENGDVRIHISRINGLGDKFIIKFYTTDKNNYVTRTDQDVIKDDYLRLDWTVLKNLGQGVLMMNCNNVDDDKDYNDGIYNYTFTRTTSFYIVTEGKLDMDSINDSFGKIQDSIEQEAEERKNADEVIMNAIEQVASGDLYKPISSSLVENDNDYQIKDTYDKGGTDYDILGVKFDKNSFELNEEGTLKAKADITDIYTKEETEEKIADVEAKIPTKVSELENDANYITKADIPEVDLSDYYTKTETDTKIGEVEAKIPDTSKFETIEHSEATYALKTDIPTVPTKVSELENDSNFVTNDTLTTNYYSKAQTEAKIESVISGEIDLGNYYKKTETYSKEEVDTQLATKVGMSVLDNYYDKTEADAKYATQEVVNEEIAARIKADGEINTTLLTKADKSEIPTVPTNVSTFTNDAKYITLEEVPATDLSNYYTKTEADEKYATQYNLKVTDSKVTTNANNIKIIQSTVTTNSNIIKTLQTTVANKVDTTTYTTDKEALEASIDTKANTDDVYTKDNTYSKEEVDAKGYVTEAQLDLTDYYKKSEIDTKITTIEDEIGTIKTALVAINGEDK